MKFIFPSWPVPANIRAAITLKTSNLDLALNNPQRAKPCQELRELLTLPAEPIWLQQVHGSNVVLAEQCVAGDIPQADACIANYGDHACAVMTADCLPILLCDKKGSQIAAVHAGWRGQVAGIIEKTVNQMTVPAADLLVWLGPAISSKVYEVGTEVYNAFMQAEDDMLAQVFKQVASQHWLLDLSKVAMLKLQALGIPQQQIFCSDNCTYTESKLFYSYRRSQTNRRMASLIWFCG